MGPSNDEQDVSYWRKRALEEERKREAAEQRQEQAEQRQEQERLQREAAERSLQPVDLQTYLRRCHELCIRLPVGIHTTTGDAANPVDRWYPQRITPWTDFRDTQRATWQALWASETVQHHKNYDTPNQFDGRQRNIDVIDSEDGVRTFAHNAVESYVKKLIDAAGEDATLRREFHLEGSVNFQSHANLCQHNARATAESSELVSELQIPRPRGIGRADQFCISNGPGTRRQVVAAIEYKAPHKVPMRAVRMGLEGEIRLAVDVIQQESEELPFLCKALMAAIVTQLYSYMLANGVRYGYVCTGEAFIFLRLGRDDPSQAEYAVSIPKEDCTGQETDCWTEHVAVAEVSAFLLQAIRAGRPSRSWLKRGLQEVQVWQSIPQEIDDHLPATIERQLASGSTYQPSHDRASRVAGLTLRQRRVSPPSPTPRTLPRRDDKDSDSDKEGVSGARKDPPGPIERRQTRSRTAAARKQPQQQPPPSNGRGGSSEKKGSSSRLQSFCASSFHPAVGGPSPLLPRLHPLAAVASSKTPSYSHIRCQPYCSQQCLSGLLLGRSVDDACPNRQYHDSKHPSPLDILQLFRLQLNQPHLDDHTEVLRIGQNARTICKVRLVEYGYTLVAKMVLPDDVADVKREWLAYQRLRPLQGRAVPVCLGRVTLQIPYYLGLAYPLTHLLLLSWAGESLAMDSRELTAEMRDEIASTVCRAVGSLHRHGVLHGDIALRNIVSTHPEPPSAMILDFGRCCLKPERAPLAAMSSNRKRRRLKKKAEADFGGEEASRAQMLMQRWVKDPFDYAKLW